MAQMNTRRLREVMVWGMAVIATLLIGQWRGFELAERWTLDAIFDLRGTAPVPEIDASFVVIGLDEDFMARMTEPVGLMHRPLVELFEDLAAAQPKFVAVDLLLPTKSYNDSPVLGQMAPDLHGALIQAVTQVASQFPVLAIRSLDPRSGQLINPHPDTLVALQLPEILEGKAPSPLPSSVLCEDPDGLIRVFPGEGCQPFEADGRVLGLVERTLALDGKSLIGPGWVDYSVGDSMSYLPLADFLALPAEQQKLRLQGKAVWLGAILDFEDRRRVPRPLFAAEPDRHDVPGVMVHLQAWRAAMAGRIIKGAPPWIVVFVTVLVAGLWWLPYSRWLAAAAAVATLGMIAACYWAYLAAVLFPVMFPLLAGAGFLIVRAALESWRQRKERYLLTRVFEGYVSAPVLRKITHGGLALQPKGEKIHACILFADIRNFTTRCEKASPEHIVHLLNRYLGEMTQAIQHHGGCIDKFIGDGIMAIFGAPERLPCPEESAYLAAQEMLQRLAVLNGEIAALGEAPLEIGIGLHSGDVVVGSIGSSLRLEYTAIGDVVNTASRVEGLCKSIGAPIVMTEAVFHHVNDPDVERVGEVEVKGRAAVLVFAKRRVRVHREERAN